MIKTLIKVGLVLVVGIIGYNYFLGNESEQQQSREIVGKVGDLGKDAWALLKSEREKMREGKYDAALEKLDGLYTDLRERARRIKDSGALDRLRDLDDLRAELESELDAAGDEPSAETKRKIEDLTAKTEELMNEMEKESE